MENYYRLYPQIPIELFLYFSDSSLNDNGIKPNSVMKFCSFYKKKYGINELPQPRIVSQMCEILVANGALSVASRGGHDGMDNKYICFRKGEVDWNDDMTLASYNQLFSFIIYGFPFVYEYYKPYVLPIEYTDYEENISLGTCFRFHNGIVSARHCFEGARRIKIQGISAIFLQNAKFFVHQKEKMDLVYVELPELPDKPSPFYGDANLLDEVITLGYPKIAGYHNFLSVEKAMVSSRFTATTGQIVASAEDIWIRENLFLISARIKGGNSGGPVINKNGRIVGVSVNMTKGEGNYDDLGYGTVIPMSFVIKDIIEKGACKSLDFNQIEFRDFDYE